MKVRLDNFSFDAVGRLDQYRMHLHLGHHRTGPEILQVKAGESYTLYTFKLNERGDSVMSTDVANLRTDLLSFHTSPYYFRLTEKFPECIPSEIELVFRIYLLTNGEYQARLDHWWTIKKYEPPAV